MIKLKNIVESLPSQRNEQQVSQPQQPMQTSEPSQEQNTGKMSKEQKKKLAEMVSRYNEYGRSIYRETKITDIGNNLKEIADLAESYALNECGDWFEEGTVKRNFQEIKKYCEQFNKLAKEANSKQMQMEALYEDIGNLLERYFEIKN